MGKPVFIFVLHFHQPVGQIREVNDRIVENSYRNLVNLLNEHPKVKVGIHISGPLLHYLGEYYPDIIEGVRKLADSGIAELIGGTYGEAILPLIPLEDRVKQVSEYNKLFKKIVGDYPLKGFWIPERFWDPLIPAIIAKEGYEYVMVDDQLLSMKGYSWSDSKHAWITENSGYKTYIMFIDTEIRYRFLFRSVDDAINYILSASTITGNPYILWGSDAEKFGEWVPWDRAEAWLRSFFTKYEASNSFEMMKPMEYLKAIKPKGLVYLPHGSYDKMMEWSGGLVFNFLTKYKESNNMHKKMIYVGRKVREALRLTRDIKTEEMIKYYLLAQCNDAYWHGLFGGTYIADLRDGVYENLIKAEKIADSILGNNENVVIMDFDYDGNDEVILESRKLNAYIHPNDGGTLFELDIKIDGLEHNLINTMSRYQEPYLSDLPTYKPDWYRRVSFREHIWGKGIGPYDWIDNIPFIDVSDLAIEPYTIDIASKNMVRLRREGHDWRGMGYPVDLDVIKEFSIVDDALRVKYSVTPNAKYVGKLGIELSLMPKGAGSPKTPYQILVDNTPLIGKEPRLTEGKLVNVRSPHVEVSIDAGKEVEVWVAEIETLSRTEKGVKKHFQGIGLVLNYLIDLNKGESAEWEISMRIRKI
jgi:hypothetical protein